MLFCCQVFHPYKTSFCFVFHWRGGLAVTCRRVLLIDDSSEVCSSSTKRESESAVKKTLANVGKASSFVLPCSLIRKSLLCVRRLGSAFSLCSIHLWLVSRQRLPAGRCGAWNAYALALLFSFFGFLLDLESDFAFTTLQDCSVKVFLYQAESD